VAAKAEREPIRIWVAGCSTGEEACSRAILFTGYLEAGGYRRDVKIFATDIDKDAIEFASCGVYPESIAADARWKIYRYKGGHRSPDVQFSTPDLQRMARSMDNRLHRTWEAQQGP